MHASIPAQDCTHSSCTPLRYAIRSNTYAPVASDSQHPPAADHQGCVPRTGSKPESPGISPLRWAGVWIPGSHTGRSAAANTRTVPRRATDAVRFATRTPVKEGLTSCIVCILKLDGAKGGASLLLDANRLNSSKTFKIKWVGLHSARVHHHPLCQQHTYHNGSSAERESMRNHLVITHLVPLTTAHPP